jgi:hypothetical protein
MLTIQTSGLALANLIWQQRTPEAAELMGSLIKDCTCHESDRALEAIETLQSDFVASIFHHPLTAKFMLASPALLRCVRLLLDACDSLGANIDDDMANFMAAATCIPSQVWLHRLFPLNPELELHSLCERNVCIAKVATSFNQVGLSLWTAGFCLIEACLGGLLPLSGKIVCEVGAGVGMTAVALYKASASFPRMLPARLIMTDYCAQVLENMDSTIVCNGVEHISIWKNDPPLRPPPNTFVVSDLLDVRDPRACAEFAVLHQVSLILQLVFHVEPNFHMRALVAIFYESLILARCVHGRRHHI